MPLRIHRWSTQQGWESQLEKGARNNSQTYQSGVRIRNTAKSESVCYSQSHWFLEFTTGNKKRKRMTTANNLTSPALRKAARTLGISICRNCIWTNKRLAPISFQTWTHSAHTFTWSPTHFMFPHSKPITTLHISGNWIATLVHKERGGRNPPRQNCNSIIILCSKEFNNITARNCLEQSLLQQFPKASSRGFSGVIAFNWKFLSVDWFLPVTKCAFDLWKTTTFGYCLYRFSGRGEPRWRSTKLWMLGFN